LRREDIQRRQEEREELLSKHASTDSVEHHPVEGMFLYFRPYMAWILCPSLCNL
jgi:hypothetical protein